MAIELIDGDILHYTLRALYQGQTILNTWHFKITQFTPELVDYEDVSAAIMNELEAEANLIDDLTALVVTGYTMVDHRIQRVWPTRNRAVVNVLNSAGVVAIAGAPANQAAVITKYGNVAGRFAIGSWHQAGFASTVSGSAGLISQGFQDSLLAAVDNLMTVEDVTGFAGTAALPVLWSPLVPTRVTPIAQIVPQATTRVMRRRTVGLGI